MGGISGWLLLFPPDPPLLNYFEKVALGGKPSLVAASRPIPSLASSLPAPSEAPLILLSRPGWYSQTSISVRGSEHTFS
jgi:hypothetical protein